MNWKNVQAKVLGAFQTFAGALVTPIIVLVVGALAVGFGSPFANYILTPGSFFHTLASALNSIGTTVMGNTPLWFAVGMSYGIAREHKGFAALAGLFLFVSLNTTISIFGKASGLTAATVNYESLVAMGYAQKMAEVMTFSWKNVLGIFTYDMAIFGSIVVGLTIGCAMNKWGNIKLPTIFEFFAGPKFVVLLVPLFALLEGAVLFQIWPYFAMVINALSTFIAQTGLIGTFVYGAADRALLPFGIHHLITSPLNSTQMGGVMMIDGAEIYGTRAIEAALIASPTATGYQIRNFKSGRLLLNLGAWPGAGVAMYLLARPENRKKVLGILVPAVFTAAFVGVTEPIEFTVLFANPLLYYLIHVPLSGLAYVLTEATKVSIQGFAFVFLIPNILQPHKVHAMSLLFLIPLYFGLYFSLFYWAIKKFDIQTPGRGKSLNLASRTEIKEFKKGLVKDDQATSLEKDMLAQAIIDTLGGSENIIAVENCLTRLRITLKDSSMLPEKEFFTESLNAIGVVMNGNKIQIIYGPKVNAICAEVKKLL